MPGARHRQGELALTAVADSSVVEPESWQDEPGTRRRFGNRDQTVTYLAFGFAVLVVVWLVGIPLAMLVYKTFTRDGDFTLEGFGRAYGGGEIWGLVRNTLVFAFGSMIVATTFGTVLAYISVRTDTPFRRLINVAAIVPLIIPTILYAPAWVFIASPTTGVLNSWLDTLFGIAPLNIYTMWGMMWVQGIHAVPLVFLFMSPAMRATDPAIEEAAMVAGVSRLRIFWSLTLPLVRPSLAACALITFVQGLDVFEVPALIGLSHGIRVLSSQIFYLQRRFPADDQATGVIALSLFAVAAIGIFLISRMGGNLRRFGTISGKAFRPRVVPLGRARPLVGAFALLYFFVAVALPIMVLVYSSLVPYYSPPSRDSLSTVSFDNFRAVFDDPIAIRSFRNTLTLGIAAACIVLLLSLIVSYISIRTRLPGRRALDAMTFAPVTIPGLVLGLSIAYVYLRSPVRIYGTMWIILIAYATRFLPYAMRFVTASMSSVALEIEEAARVAGASRLQVVRRIILPLTAPGLIAGWIFILIMAFRELQASLLLYSPGKEVLAVMIFEQYNNGKTSVLAAIGVLMMIILTGLASIASYIQKRSGIKVQ